MDRTKFYASLRKRDSGVFGTSLKQGQVDGCEAILDECLRQGADLGQAAYILGTAYGESAHKMQPTYENLKYSAKRIPQVFGKHRRQGKTPRELAGNPELLANTVYGGEWGREELGNIEHADGWRFRGAGIGQITGRTNFRKFGDKLGIPLLQKPEMLMTLRTSVRALVEPMLDGWATGKKLSLYVEGDRRDYVSARRVWNGTFEAKKYAGYAKAFETALEAAGYDQALVPPPPDFVRPEPQPTQNISDPDDDLDFGRPTRGVEMPGAALIASILNLILSLFGRKQ